MTQFLIILQLLRNSSVKCRWYSLKSFAVLWLRQNFKAVSSLTVVKCSNSSVTHWKTSLWSLTVFVVWFLDVALLLLPFFNGSLFISFMLMDWYIPGALLMIPPACEELGSATCSFLPAECKQRVLQCVDGGRIFQEEGLGQTSCLVNEQALSLSLFSCSDRKNNSPFVRFRKLLSSERQNSDLFSWHARAHLSAFLLQAHSWVFSPCPKLTARISPCCNFQDPSFMLLTPVPNEVSAWSSPACLTEA